MTSVYKSKFQDITKKGTVSLWVLAVDHYVCTVDHKNCSVPHHHMQVRYRSHLVDEISLKISGPALPAMAAGTL
jgi:hypothetical protein